MSLCKKQRNLTEPMIIETPRLILRDFSLEDALVLSKILSDPQVMEFSLGILSFDETVQLIKKQISSMQENGFALYAVIHKETNTLFGYAGLVKQMIEGAEYIELGYRLDHHYWRQGYGFEAAVNVKDFAFADLNLSQIVSIIDPKNIASIRLAEKIRMKRIKSVTFYDQLVDLYQIENSRS